MLVIGTVAYSSYEDYSALRADRLLGTPRQAVGREVLRGTAETVSINITVPNRGLYSLNVTITCSYPTANVVCQRTSVDVAPGSQGVLYFVMNVGNVTQFETSVDQDINGTVAISMPPFAFLTIGTDLGGFVKTGAG